MGAARHRVPDAPRAGVAADAAEQRLVLGGLTYKDYVLLSDVLGHRPGLHLTFLDGTLEIMTVSPLHDFAVLAEHDAMADQDDAVRAYWSWLGGA